jgi:hypothetical protein
MPEPLSENPYLRTKCAKRVHIYPTLSASTVPSTYCPGAVTVSGILARGSMGDNARLRKLS